MDVAVRYHSRSGNTRLVAEAIAEAVGTKAVAVGDKDGALDERVDLLFVGGALYAYGIDAHLRQYLRSLDASKVGRAAVFSTSWLSRHAIDLVRRELEAKGIEVVDSSFYAKGRPGERQLADARAFAAQLT